MEEQQACETPLEDLRNSALAEYELASNAIHSWNSFIVNAIKNYDPKSNRLEKLVSQPSELLPCPFCGNKAECSNKFDEFYAKSMVYAHCTNCWCKTYNGTKDEVKNLWNKRASQ